MKTLIPRTETTARQLIADVQRARAQAALIQARYTRWADLDTCLRCDSADRIPGGAYCAPCQAHMDVLVERLMSKLPADGWGVETPWEA